VRTTLTLDGDVQAKLEREAHREGKSFKDVVNYYLRLGLAARQAYEPRRKFNVRARPMSLREGLSAASVASLIGELEGPSRR
jgi:hypothetical protein